jgi:hypothetical protein
MDEKPKQAAAKPAAKGINWLTVFGIVVLIVLIVLVVWGAVIWGQAKNSRLLQAVIALAPALQEMETLTQAQIQDQAQLVAADRLGADPEGYAGRYMMVEGAVSDTGGDIGLEKNIALNVFSDTPYMGYLLDDAVVLIDISKEAPMVPNGAVIRGYGKVLVVSPEDIWKLPVVGANLKKEFAEKGMMEKVVFFLSKGIKIMAPAKPGEAKPPAPAPEAGAPADGEGAAPGAPTPSPAAPPAEGGTAPPEGEAPAPGGGT